MVISKPPQEDLANLSREARLEADSPVQGLASDSVASCCALVFHCASTGRTIMAHTPSFYHLSELLNMVHWVAGGDGELPVVPFNWAMGPIGWPPSFKPNVDVNVVVLKGTMHAMPNNGYRHEFWQQCFDIYFSSAKSRLGINLKVQHVEQALPTGAVSVNKQGVITIYKASAQAMVLLTKHFTELPYMSWVERALFIANFIAFYQEGEYPIWLQYDGEKLLAPPTFPSSACREHWRFVRLGLPSPYHQSPTYVRAPPQVKMMSKMSDPLVKSGKLDPCEICTEHGAKLCSGCKGAAYCGPAHQKEDWGRHKAWCKTHPVSAVK
jgi:hypothetical protein